MLAKCVAALLFLLLVVLNTEGARAQTSSQSEGRFRTALRLSIGDQWQIRAQNELRFADEGLFYHHVDGSASLHVFPWLNTSAALRVIRSKDGEGNWGHDLRAHGNITAHVRVASLTVSDRHRIEYRMRGETSNKWRYRNRLTVQLEEQAFALGLSPWVAGEIFVDFSEGALNRNRLYLGVKQQVLRLRLDAYYLWQRSIRAGQQTTIVAVGLGVAFYK